MAMNFVTFNQDYSHLAVGTSRGFRIYTTDPFSKCFETKQGDISLLEMLFSTSLVALVLTPRRLQITNTKRKSTICELTFPTAVLAVRMNRKRLVVVLEDQIYLYDISNMRLLHTIETSPNPGAICALAPSSENGFLAYPLPQKAAIPAPPSSSSSHTPPAGPSHHIPPTSGAVLLFDTVKLEAINVIEAHRAPLSCITINDAGTLLATASDKGTIIRVFSLPAARKLYQFRRGSMPSRICSMAFNATCTLLCVSSTTETVHIFKLAPSNATGSTADARRRSSASSGNRKPLSNYFFSNSTASTNTVEDNESNSTLVDTDSNGHDGSMRDRKHNGTLMGLIRRTSQNVGTSVAGSLGAYLPTAVSEMWEPARDFAWLKVPRANAPIVLGNNNTTTTTTNNSNEQPASPGTNPAGIMTGLVAAATTVSTQPLRSVVAMSPNAPQVMLVTSDGHFYVFGIDLERGGEGMLLKVYEIGGEGDSFSDQ